MAQELDLDQSLSVNYFNQPLDEVIKNLSELSGIRFSYSASSIPADTKITYLAEDKPLNQILNDILLDLGVEYEVIGNYIVLTNLELIIVEESPKKPQKYTISGFIVDTHNSEALIGAAVYNPETGLGTLSNNYGYFSITLPEGNYTMETSFLGYASTSKSFELNSHQKWNISLEEVRSMVEEVVISSVNREELIFTSLAAQTNVQPFDIKYESAAMGETDMLKSLDNLPGISFQSDGSSYFFVRGGGRDQNLILLDEAPLFNPSHMLGLFTPIIPDAVKTAKVYKADFPIEYGGRLASVIDVRTRDGNKERFSGTASMGLVSTRFSVEGPILKNKSSFFIAYRRSYFGWVFKAIQPDIRDFYFTDYTTKFNIQLTKKDRLFVSFYRGQDKFLINNPADSLMNGLEWTNTAFTMRWNHVFGERLFSNTTMYSSMYNYYLHTDYDNGYNWNSRINGSHLKSEFTYYINPQNQIKFGLKLGGYFFNPGNYNYPDVDPNQTVSEVNSSEVILYAGNEHQIGEKLLINYGLRFTVWSDIGESFVVQYENYDPVDLIQYSKGENYFTTAMLEPRVSLSYKTAKYASLKASYNRSVQNIHLINNSISPFNTLEVWLPTGPNIKPQFSDIYNFGYVQSWPEKKIDFNADLFFKKLYNQIGYTYHAQTLLNPLIEGELRQGHGKAYGFEVSLQKTYGRLTGQLGYSFTRSLLKINGLNNNQPYKARQDKPVDVSLSLAYYLKPRWLMSANLMYSSGLMTTVPTGFYYYRGSQVPLYTEQNNDRMPAYIRFDLGFDWRLNKQDDGPIKHHLILAFYNFFNDKNSAFLYFTKTQNSNGDFVIPTDKLNYPEQIPTHRYIYSIIPSLTYND
jgi:hypothetical protein